MDFSDALRALKGGEIIRRKEWAPDVGLILVPGSTITVASDRPLGLALPELVGEPVEYRPHIDKVRRGWLEPWSPTDSALLADDWEVPGG